MAKLLDDEDLLEQILLTLDVKDLLRCKSVCKSWYSLITSPRFIKCHLNHSYNKDHNNNHIGHRKISLTSYDVLGSSNGLVLVSVSTGNYFDLLVGNPLTREVTQRRLPSSIRSSLLCVGFGYNSYTDDYAVIVGAWAGEDVFRTCVQMQVLSLKSNVWKVVGELKCSFITNEGILCNGALHWIVHDHQKGRIVVLSYDLSKEEFQEIPPPDDARYECSSSSCLGIVKGCLCVDASAENGFSHGIWLMKEYNVKESWELLPHGCEMKYDIVHYMRTPNWKSLFFSAECFSGTLEYICDPISHIQAPIFVQSLVSPHVSTQPEEKTQATRQVMLIKGGLSAHGPNA